MAGRPYSVFGKVLDELARARQVRGPYWIADHMKARLGAEKAVSGVAVGKWMYGESHPRSDNLEKFSRAFDLDEPERIRLAYAYAYNKDPERD